MTIIQHIKKNICVLLAMMGVFSVTSCRDFKDCRTPYKSFVAVKFIPINKDATITNEEILELIRQSSSNKFYPLYLNPDEDSVTMNITPKTFPNTTLTIHYQKEAVLISHQGGCAYKYTLKKITSTFNGKYKIINKELSTLNDSAIDVQIYL